MELGQVQSPVQRYFTGLPNRSWNPGTDSLQGSFRERTLDFGLRFLSFLDDIDL